ncbi:MAG TPA: XdhC family protein, partial [Usitatibacteraceae bacterium]|nr:XdhC family protein [Usitatibacteraceae bacterium]
QSLDFEVLDSARRWIGAGHRVWLVTVTQTFGASPRPPGSMMVMRDDGLIAGSVSGGCIEDDLVARRDEFNGAVPRLQDYGIDADEARRFGLPCGGQLQVLVEAAVDAPRLDALFTRIAAGEVFARAVDLASGDWQLRAAGAAEETAIGEHLFTCIHGPRWRLMIIGASEIARYLAEMAKALDFQVLLCDPREEYRAAWRIEGIGWVEGMPDDAVLALRPDQRTVIVAVSHDPKLDDMALIEALKGNAFYVGAVGSKKTSDERRRRLRECAEFGLSERDVARLHGPVGLAIGSRTPPEIAVAILAELVAARNSRVLAMQPGAAQSCAA